MVADHTVLRRPQQKGAVYTHGGLALKCKSEQTEQTQQLGLPVCGTKDSQTHGRLADDLLMTTRCHTDDALRTHR